MLPFRVTGKTRFTDKTQIEGTGTVRVILLPKIPLLVKLCGTGTRITRLSPLDSIAVGSGGEDGEVGIFGEDSSGGGGSGSSWVDGCGRGEESERESVCRVDF
jgi:uncharacterized membrane protein YgcG